MSSSSSFVTAAFRSAHENEAYIFLKNKYVIDNYRPGQGSDQILYGPVANSDGLSSLKSTIFGEYGIDCAFASHDIGKAYIFAFNDCALLDYSPFTPKSDKLIKGPMSIVEMFPFLKGTVCENGVDAAFESSVQYEAYLFKGDKYVRINYGQNGSLLYQGSIANNWPCLVGTIFENGIGASFALDRPNEAYLFKDEYYALMKFTPGQSNDYLMSPVRKIKETWPELGNLLPSMNMSNN